MSDSFDFLDLPGIRTTNVIRRADRTIVEAESIVPRFVCCMFQRLGKWGDRPTRRVVNDTHHGGLPLAIHLRVRRAQCYECGKRGLTEVFDFIRPNRKMTKRLGNYIAKQTVLVGDTSSAAGRHIHISASTARRITNHGVDLGLLGRALHARSSIIRWADQGGEEERLPSGLSTIQPIWDDRL